MRGSVGRRLVEVDMGVTASVSIKSLLYRVRCSSYYCLVVSFHHCILPIICQIWIAMKCQGVAAHSGPRQTRLWRWRWWLCLLWEYSIFKLTIFPAAARRSRARLAQPAAALVTVSNLCLGRCWLLLGDQARHPSPSAHHSHHKGKLWQHKNRKIFFPKIYI